MAVNKTLLSSTTASEKSAQFKCRESFRDGAVGQKIGIRNLEVEEKGPEAGDCPKGKEKR